MTTMRVREAEAPQARLENVSDVLSTIVRDEFGSHPFRCSMDKQQLQALLPDYLGMSVSFRYLQAAAQKPAIFEAIHENREVPKAIEVTNAISNFLTWDESGGNEMLATHGKAGLRMLLDTSRWFHSDILRSDAAKIFGHPIRTHYSAITQRYLMELYDGLASTEVVRRCANMVAFELHASQMIESLWGTISNLAGLAPVDLGYFHLHMGGNDPAEGYHVRLTQELIDRVVPPGQGARFLTEFRGAYNLSFAWCRALVEQAAQGQGIPATGDVWHRGACHCGGVQFEVHAPRSLDVVRCNCSICDKTGFLHLLVQPERFRLTAGEGLLTTYQFNTHVARHTFCKICGIKPFYRPRSNPNGFSVNVRCLDRQSIIGMDIREFDGQHWEEHIHEVA